MTYPEAIDYLLGIRLFGQQLGLATMEELAGLLGRPQDQLRFIHIAGTNGKGSVAAMIHSVLTEAGYRTGLYTSPHLVSFCERFQINRQPITEIELTSLVEQLRPQLAEVANHPGCRQPTLFEVTTALALQWFRARQVDVVVWETGLGGRLDATNIVTPLVSVITSIAYDHMQYLGATLAQIAQEKCGIIKPGVPVITAATPPEATEMIYRTAATKHCPVGMVGKDITATSAGMTERGQRVALHGCRQEYGVLEIPLLGDHQLVNCATAVAALEASGLAMTVEQVRRGLARTEWPGRFQVLAGKGTVVLDGAHNPAAAELLAGTLRQQFPGRRINLILGVLRDKNYEEICRILAPLASEILCVPVNSERTSDPALLADRCRQANPAANVRVVKKPADAYAELADRTGEIIVITGSLFLVGEMLARLGKSPRPTGDKELVLQ